MKWTRHLPTVVNLLALLTPALYLFGMMYQGAYVNGFGLEDSLFPFPKDKTLFSGFWVLVNLGLRPIFYVTAGLTAVIILSIGLYVLSTTRWAAYRYIRYQRYLRKVKKRHRKVMFLEEVANHVQGFGQYTSSLIFFVLALIATALVSHDVGKNQAKKEIAEFSAGKGRSEILYSPLFSTPKRVRQIICSTTHCAYWMGTEALVLPLSSIERIVPQYLIDQAEDSPPPSSPDKAQR